MILSCIKLLITLKDVSVDVFLKKNIVNGRVMKKTYIPEIRWVIEIKADIGSLILNRFIFTGLAVIIFWDICLFINKSR